MPAVGARNPMVNKNCLTCNNEFSVPPSRATAKYCCQTCQIKNNENNPNWKGGLVKSSCLVCGEETAVKRSHAAKGAGKFCSIVCRSKHASNQRSLIAWENRVVKNCIVCNSEIRVKKSHEATEGTYCGKACMALDYATRLSGGANPNFRHGNAHVSGFYIKQRKGIDGFYPKEYPAILYVLQKGKFVNCLKPLKNKYHIDHIQPVAKGGTNHHWNLQLLCPSCNCKKHAKDPIDWAQENGRLL
jgi:hypothetical protein